MVLGVNQKSAERLFFNDANRFCALVIIVIITVGDYYLTVFAVGLR